MLLIFANNVFRMMRWLLSKQKILFKDILDQEEIILKKSIYVHIFDEISKVEKNYFVVQKHKADFI